MKRMLIMVATAISAAASCDKTLIQDGIRKDSIELEVEVNTGGASKAMITASTLEDGSEIGITLLASDGGLYDGISYENIRYTSHSTSYKQSWTSESVVMLSATKAALYSYYPYSSSVASIRSIPVRADSMIQTDYMYGTPVRGLYNHSALASIHLNHALSVVQFSLSRGNYTGAGTVSGISVKGKGMARKGILDATTGQLSSFEEENMDIAPVIGYFNLDSNNRCNIIVIPNGKNELMEIEIMIDGEPFQIKTDPLTLRQGSIAAYNIAVNNGGAKISDMTVNDWGYTSEGNILIEQNYKITVTGDTEGISFDNKFNSDGSVQIIAVPYHSEDAEVNPVEITGNATLTQYVYPDRGLRIIQLSDIRSDISVIFHSYCLWMTATYDITDTSTSTPIYYSPAGRPNNPVRMQVDGQEQSPSASYFFTTKGEHRIRYAFKDKSDVGYGFFNSITTLTYARIPEGVRTLGHSTFFGCRRLASVDLPSTLNEIGYECFRDAMSLKVISIPETALNLGTALFRGCSTLSSVSLPSGLVKIPDTMFRECTSLSHMKVNEGVSTIGSSAFIYSGIQSIDLPSTLTYMDSDALSNCYQLSSITCRATTPPGLYAYSDIFTGIKSNGVLYVPSGAESSYQSKWLQGQFLNKNWTITTIQ